MTNPLISVGTTLPAWKIDDNGYWWVWLQEADAITQCTKEGVGFVVEWVVALEEDARGRQLFAPVIDRLMELADQGIKTKVYWFSFDNGDDEIAGAAGSAGKVLRCILGRNIVMNHALDSGAAWHYSTDVDMRTPIDGLIRLLELDYPATALNSPTFCLDGPPVLKYRPWDVRQHWHSGGSFMLHRDLFRRVPWRWDPDASQFDDAATMTELERLGYPLYVRHDIECQHFPLHVLPVEERGHDLTIHR